MIFRQSRFRPFAKAVIAAALLPAAIVALGAMNPDRLLERAYATAEHGPSAPWSAALDVAQNVRPASLSPSTIRKPFAVGDRMVIDTRGASPEAIEITAIEQVDGATLGLDGIAFQMVTGRSATNPDGGTLRFLFAVETPAGSKPGSAL